MDIEEWSVLLGYNMVMEHEERGKTTTYEVYYQLMLTHGSGQKPADKMQKTDEIF